MQSLKKKNINFKKLIPSRKYILPSMALLSLSLLPFSWRPSPDPYKLSTGEIVVAINDIPVENKDLIKNSIDSSKKDFIDYTLKSPSGTSRVLTLPLFREDGVALNGVANEKY